jgi:hypothetical protein
MLLEGTICAMTFYSFVVPNWTFVNVNGDSWLQFTTNQLDIFMEDSNGMRDTFVLVCCPVVLLWSTLFFCVAMVMMVMLVMLVLIVVIVVMKE